MEDILAFAFLSLRGCSAMLIAATPCGENCVFVHFSIGESKVNKSMKMRGVFPNLNHIQPWLILICKRSLVG